MENNPIKWGPYDIEYISLSIKKIRIVKVE